MRRGPALNGRITAADRVLLMLLFAAIGTCFAALWTPGGPATEAEIRVGGELRQTLNLSQPGEYRIDGHNGVSVLRVEPGKLRFVESPCRNRVCIHRGWLNTAGDSTACLPNRVSVSLRGHGPGAVDAVNH